MNKFYQVSTPWLDKVEKKYVNIALKNNEISGFFGRYIPEFEKKLEAGDPFPGFIENVLDCLPIPRLPKGMTPHMNCLDPDTLSRECKSAGFEIITSKYFGPSRASSNYGKDHAGIIAIKQ